MGFSFCRERKWNWERFDNRSKRKGNVEIWGKKISYVKDAIEKVGEISFDVKIEYYWIFFCFCMFL